MLRVMTEGFLPESKDQTFITSHDFYDFSSLQCPHASHMTHVAVLWANNDDKTAK